MYISFCRIQNPTNNPEFTVSQTIVAPTVEEKASMEAYMASTAFANDLLGGPRHLDTSPGTPNAPKSDHEAGSDSDKSTPEGESKTSRGRSSRARQPVKPFKFNSPPKKIPKTKLKSPAGEGKDDTKESKEEKGDPKSKPKKNPKRKPEAKSSNPAGEGKGEAKASAAEEKTHDHKDKKGNTKSKPKPKRTLVLVMSDSEKTESDQNDEGDEGDEADEGEEEHEVDSEVGEGKAKKTRGRSTGGITPSSKDNTQPVKGSKPQAQGSSDPVLTQKRNRLPRGKAPGTAPGTAPPTSPILLGGFPMDVFQVHS